MCTECNSRSPCIIHAEVASGAKLVGGLILILPPRTASEGPQESDSSEGDDQWQQVAAVEEALLKLNLPVSEGDGEPVSE